MKHSLPEKAALFSAIVGLLLLVAAGYLGNDGSTASTTLEDRKKSLNTDAGEMDPRIQSIMEQPYIFSLESRENGDFLITPALLIQEIMTPEVVVTYPTE